MGPKMMDSEQLPTKNCEDSFQKPFKLDPKIYDTLLNDKSYRTLWGTFQTPIIWSHVITIAIIHVLAIHGLATINIIKHNKSFFWHLSLGIISGFGVTGGAHRLWTHRSYKAKLPLRILLLICYMCAGQNSLFDWVRDHRVHHKFSETHADPHNSNRGMFFAHIGWLFLKKRPEVLEKGRSLDYSDLFKDKVFLFGQKHFWTMSMLFAHIIPITIPCLLWNEPLYDAILGSFIRYAITLHSTFLVNSLAHYYGTRPYNKSIQPVESQIVALLSMGEGWHNYHHTFPWDYKAAELTSLTMNATTHILNFFAKIGWAYDLKTPSPELVLKVIKEKGGLDDHEEVPYETQVQFQNSTSK